MILEDGERIDDLEYKGLKIIQREGLYHFTSDSVLLANLSEVYRNARVLDMGTGSGIISILLAAKTEAKEIIGIDIQECMLNMAERSVILNNLSERVKIIKSDIKEAPQLFGHGSFDIVITNPPYNRINTGEVHESEHLNICRSEVLITLEQIIDSASKLLKFGGKFYIVHKSNRLAEIIYLMSKYKLTPKKLINIMPKTSKDVDTIIIEGKKGAKDGIKVETLVVYNEDGTMTKRAAKLYAKEII